VVVECLDVVIECLEVLTECLEVYKVKRGYRGDEGGYGVLEVVMGYCRVLGCLFSVVWM